MRWSIARDVLCAELLKHNANKNDAENFSRIILCISVKL